MFRAASCTSPRTQRLSGESWLRLCQIIKKASFGRSTGQDFINLARSGDRTRADGDVRVIGQDMFKVYSGEPYILAYLPDRYIFDVKKGDRVNVSTGSVSASGKIDEVLPVADALPPEFQNIFKPRDRSRLVKISLSSRSAFAVSQKVYITGAWW